jgi:hypothetical protein
MTGYRGVPEALAFILEKDEETGLLIHDHIDGVGSLCFICE